MLDVNGLRSLFGRYYPDAGEIFVCRAPGRVNIIGEHTDYNGLPVLPMTLDRAIGIAFSPRLDGRVRMRDTDASFAPVEFANGRSIAASAVGQWENYCKAAVAGLNRHFSVGDFVGMDMLVSGDIPIGAGLSSSSALVVGCALAYLRCLGMELGRDISPLALAGVLAEAEHFVGTRGGGMDQAVILLGDEGQACKIDFFPLHVERMGLLEDYGFVVCHSRVEAAKTGAALARYNAGPRLCALACALVEARLREEFSMDVALRRLGDLWGDLCLTDGEVAELFSRTFPRDRMTAAEAAGALGLAPGEVRARWLGDLEEPPGGFPLQARARHQRTEYQRVEAARDALLAGDAGALGALMDASHASCASDFGISCPELEALVGIARDAGALGARLTGAGFGGCTVNLVPVEAVDDFQEAVLARYYGAYLGGGEVDGDVIFVAQASAGAGYVERRGKQ